MTDTNTPALPAWLLSADDMKHLRRFAECAEDCDADGHDVPKEAMKRLERLGAVRSLGFGRHETTAFGDAMLAAAPEAPEHDRPAQWWLAELDPYGNPTLIDGAHGQRAGADQAFYLNSALGLVGSRKYAVARVELSEPVADGSNVNHDAVGTLRMAMQHNAAAPEAPQTAAPLGTPQNPICINSEEMARLAELAGISVDNREEAAGILLWVGEYRDDDGTVGYGLCASEAPDLRICTSCYLINNANDVCFACGAQTEPVNDAAPLSKQNAALVAALRMYIRAGFGNSTCFIRQREAYDAAVEALASAKGGA